jgi:translation initiation factor IF-3
VRDRPEIFEKIPFFLLTTAIGLRIIAVQNKEGRLRRLTSRPWQRGSHSESRRVRGYVRVQSASALLYFLEVFSIAKLTHQLNEEIQDKELRVIGPDGAQLGIMSSKAALDLAAEQELDLVKISPTANPPVCKIMDYGKFRFDQMKKEKESRKNQRVVEVKEIRMSPNIDTNDLNTKMKNAIKFLSDGNRVKVSVRFRGREMTHTNLGEELLNQFAEGCSEVANLEKNPKMEGRFMFMFLSPKAENKK